MEDINYVWLSISVFGIFIMQFGFGLLEAGSVRSKSTQSIILKNVMDLSACSIFWYLFGYGFAFGEDHKGFIGTSKFAMINTHTDDYIKSIYYYMFASTAGTIMSGAIAERARLEGYIATNLLIVTFVHPVVAHWMWSENGWMRAFKIIDYSGTGAIHLLGAVFAFIGSLIIGPRAGRFDNELINAGFRGHSSPLVFLGTSILYSGWLFFNMSPVVFSSSPTRFEMVGVISWNTVLSASSSVTSFYLQTLFRRNKSYDVSDTCNSLLTGLVAITGCCHCIELWGSIIVGAMSSITYYAVSKTMIKLRIDDPVNAIAVHGGGGLLGMLAPAFLANPKIYPEARGAFYGNPKQIGAQLLGITSIIAWAAPFAYGLIKILHKAGFMRVSAAEEEYGVDLLNHGGQAYNIDKKKATRSIHRLDAILPHPTTEDGQSPQLGLTMGKTI